MGGIGFGLERTGFMALRHPVAALLFLLMGSLVAAWGLLNLRFDDDVVRAFRSDSATYRAFAAIEAERGALNSVIVTATAPDALDADDLKALRELHYDLEFVDNVDAVMSLFSLRHRGDGLEPGEPVVPDEFGAADVATILATARADRLTPGRIVSDDGRALMFLIVDDGTSTARESRRALLTAIENAASARATQRLRIDVLGHDAIRFEIADAIKHDLLLFTTGGGFVSMLLALFWFRSVRLTLLAVAPPVIAVLWVLGFSALAGIPLSVTTDVVPVLLIVVAFTDSMHLVHALRVEPIGPGDRTADALRRVILRVGPACVLTSLTTALAMLSLALTRYGALTDVALMGGGGVIVAFFAVILAFPAFGIVLVRDSDLGRHSDDAVPGKGFAQAVARIFPARPRLIVALAILVLSAGAIGHLTNRPDFNTYENVPENSGTLAASVEAETRFGGLFTLWAPVTGQPGAPLASPAAAVAADSSAPAATPMAAQALAAESLVSTTSTASAVSTDSSTDLAFSLSLGGSVDAYAAPLASSQMISADSTNGATEASAAAADGVWAGDDWDLSDDEVDSITADLFADEADELGSLV